MTTYDMQDLLRMFQYGKDQLIKSPDDTELNMALHNADEFINQRSPHSLSNIQIHYHAIQGARTRIWAESTSDYDRLYK